MKVIIVRPSGYSGGSLVLEVLCRLLREKGVDASLFYISKEPGKDTKAGQFWLEWLLYNCKWELFHVLCRIFPKSKNSRLSGWRPIVISPVGGVKKKYSPFFNKKNTVVVYPEKVFGNFLNAPHVVRYLLFHYPYEGNKAAYGAEDLFVAYRDVFNSPQLNPDNLVVPFGFFDGNLYRQYNYGARHGNCYIIRKGSEREDLPAVFDGPVIDKLSEEEKVKVLNESERCYSYDTQTFYTTIAAICGCLPIVVPDPGKTKDDYYGPEEAPWGVAFGESPEEIEYARTTKHLCVKRLDYEAMNEKSIGLFIEALRAKFNFS